jgi:hypothetical protein
VLLERYAWLPGDTLGPGAVEAGECDRCGEAPRVVPLCGPTSYRAVCAPCATAVGTRGWCDGHADDAAAAREWADRLPPEWATVVRLWWVATGEVRLDPAMLALDVLPVEVRAELGGR